MSEPYRVCMVCTGNICRSPMAEVVLRQRLADAGLADRVVVDSAGIIGYHEGDPMDRRARAALTTSGYEPHDHRARQFDVEWIGARDLVIALDAGHDDDLRAMRSTDDDAQVALLRSFDPAAGDDLEVGDPYYDGSFDQRLREIEAACDGLVAHLRSVLDA